MIRRSPVKPMFEFIGKILKRKPHKKPEEHHRELRSHTYAEILKELEEFEKSINDKNSQEYSKKFYGIVKKAFREGLGLKYEATIEEMKKEVQNHAHLSQDMRGELGIFLDDIAVMEYGYPEFKAIMEEERYEKERQLHEYIRDLESQGDRIKLETKKKINAIVSESIPHTDREMLLKASARFRAHISKLFK